MYNVLLANEHGEHYELPPELTEDEQLQVAFPGLEDALSLFVAPPPPLGPPPRRAAESLVLPAPAPGTPVPPMASCPWLQGPFINLSSDDKDEDGQA
jgi:hypothetical protein